MNIEWTGYVYVLKSDWSEKIYVGSTINDMNQRLRDHEKNYKKYIGGKQKNIGYTSVKLFEDGKVYYEILEQHYKANQYDLIDIEMQYIAKNKDICVNEQINKKWRNISPDKIDEKYKIVTNPTYAGF